MDDLKRQVEDEMLRRQLFRDCHALGKTVAAPLGPIDHGRLHEWCVRIYKKDSMAKLALTELLELMYNLHLCQDPASEAYEDWKLYFEVDPPAPKLAKVKHSDALR